MIQVRPWDRKVDYPLIKEWFEGNGSMGPHPSQLPPLGVVAFDEHGEHAAVGAYQSLGVGVAFPEWLITNPDTVQTIKLQAVVAAMTGLEKMLVADDYQMLRIAIIDERIAKLAGKLLGYHNVGPKVTYMVKNTSQ